MTHKKEAYEKKYNEIETELSTYKANKMSDNDRFVEYETKIKNIVEEKNEAIAALDKEKEALNSIRNESQINNQNTEKLLNGYQVRNLFMYLK